IGPRPGAEQVVRGAARLAHALGREWVAVYVETPTLQRLPSAERDRILRVVKLAHELGADTAILTGQDACEAIVRCARERNATMVVVGRRGRWSWRRTMTDAIGAADDALDVLEIGQGARVAEVAMS